MAVQKFTAEDHEQYQANVTKFVVSNMRREGKTDAQIVKYAKDNPNFLIEACQAYNKAQIEFYESDKFQEMKNELMHTMWKENQ